MSSPNIADLFDKVKKYYCGANPHRNKPENLIKDERLVSSKAGDLIDLEHDLFYEDAWLYTSLADKEGSRLIMGVDYELEDEDSIATDQSGYRVYKRVRILKDQVAIFADYEVYGDFSDVNLFNLQARRTRESMEEIADLYKRASASEAKLNHHQTKITDNENNIRSNLGKINHNAQEIENAKNAIRQNEQRIESSKTELTQMIQQEQQEREGYEGRISTVESKIRELEGFKSETQSKLQALIPVGFCYLQPQGTSHPNELWPDPDFEWEQISLTEGTTIWKRKS